MRLFTAIEIPEPLRESLSAIQDPDALQARWTDPEQFHVTLRFIGNVEEAQAARYEKVLADVNAGPVQCDPYGLDVLPSRRSPRVLMLGLERTDSLMALYDAVSDGLETEGLEAEDRAYRPHVTIGRLDEADPDAVHDYLRLHEDRSFPNFKVDRVVLYESTLTPEGAIYEPHAMYPLDA